VTSESKGKRSNFTGEEKLMQSMEKPLYPIKRSEKQYKYLVIGGWVVSKKDHLSHYVSATTLVSLYGIDRSECLLVEGKSTRYRPLEECLSKLIILRPDPSGEYVLPKK
jgi:hypothetical protein